MVSRTQVTLGFLLILLVGLIGILAPPDDGTIMDARIYCKEVHDHKWPDYDRVYDKQCHEDGSLNEKYFYGN